MWHHKRAMHFEFWVLNQFVKIKLSKISYFNYIFRTPEARKKYLIKKNVQTFTISKEKILISF